MSIPEFNTKFFCIVDWENPELAAIISSYIFEKDKYTLMFEFPSISIGEDGYDGKKQDEHSISRTRGRDLDIYLHNTIKKIGPVENLILAGLCEDQLSYLTFLDGQNIIYIDKVSEVDFF